MEHYYGNKYELKQVFLDEFKKIGVIAPACRKAGISRSTFYRWYYADDRGQFMTAFLEAVTDNLNTHRELLLQIPRHKMNSFLRECIEEEEEEKR